MSVTANVRYLTARVRRRHALLEALRQRAHRTTTAVELAQRLEVSIRTVERDVAALSEAGVPIHARRGRGGGYALATARRLPPVQLTPGEVAALIASLTELGPFGTASTATALAKLVATLTGSPDDQ